MRLWMLLLIAPLLTAATFPSDSVISGAVYRRVRTVTVTSNVATDDYLLLCNAVNGPVTINLPTASAAYDTPSKTGRTIAIKRISSLHACTIDAAGAELIDDALTLPIQKQYAAYAVMSNGTSWFVIGD